VGQFEATRLPIVSACHGWSSSVGSNQVFAFVPAAKEGHGESHQDHYDKDIPIRETD
jgi:hypothetical protein